MDKRKVPKALVPPKYHNPPLTCFYWCTRGFCIKTDQNCAYAHYNTGYYAPDPTAGYQHRHVYTTQPNAVPTANSSGPPTMASSDTSFDQNVHQAKEVESYNRLRDVELRARETKVKAKEAQLRQREALLQQRERDLYNFCSLIKREMEMFGTSAPPCTTPTSTPDEEAQAMSNDGASE